MKLLLDEDVHVQLVEPLRRLLREHQVDSRSSSRRGRRDRFLLPDASGNGYDALLTNDSAQLDSAEENRPEATASAEGAGVLRDESEPR